MSLFKTFSFNQSRLTFYLLCHVLYWNVILCLVKSKSFHITHPDFAKAFLSSSYRFSLHLNFIALILFTSAFISSSLTSASSSPFLACALYSPAAVLQFPGKKHISLSITIFVLAYLFSIVRSCTCTEITKVLVTSTLVYNVFC